MKFNKIIAAIALEDDLAEGVIKAAYSLAEKDGATLEVLSAWPLLTSAMPVTSGDVAANSTVVSEAIVEQNRAARRESLDKLTEMQKRLAPSASCQILDGEPADAIAEYAEEQGTDLIVTGSHQRNFWSSLFQGSASRDLIREAPCAVFLVTKAYAEKH
ncbi:universal stress protein [Hyphococcus sp. DH-69]|uniref:universal stress protein n=1 Tax=Hyphococcus formosus TaxID=3143534 RepID=UPI00398AA732